MLKKLTKIILFCIIRALTPPPVHWAVWDTMRSWDNFKLLGGRLGPQLGAHNAKNVDHLILI